MAWPAFDADHVMVSSEEMMELEKKIFLKGFPNSALMEKVGQAMAKWLLFKPEKLYNGVLVVVGPGHNGGDGLVVARELHLAGVSVRVWCPLQIKKKLTSQHFSYIDWLGIESVQSTPDINDKALWIDALFGLGQSRSLPFFLGKVFIERQRNRPGELVSLDIPSGLSSDSGLPFAGGTATASFTLTVGLFKKGLVQDLAMPYVGQIERIDIGLPVNTFHDFFIDKPLRIKSSDIETVPVQRPLPFEAKYKRGKTLLITGSVKYPGAAHICMRGALASGNGSSHAILPDFIARNIWKKFPEILIEGQLKSNEKSLFPKDGLLISKDIDNFDSILIGPGLGRAEEDWSASANDFIGFKGLLILDADALNRISSCKDGWHWLAKRKSPTWLTPHHGEFKRLFPSINLSSPIEAVVEASRMTGAYILLKGANTVIASPAGQIWQLGETAPWVARAGLGDLLSGFLAGLGAISIASLNKVPPEQLAVGAFLHSQAGLRCKKGSSATVIADELQKITTELNSKMSF